MSSDLASDYFRLFGLPLSYRIDAAKLTERYRDLQQRVHPDRFASASDQERRLSMQQATRINEAYRVLKDPLERARYLLELKGHAWHDDSRTLQDPGFLMQQMEMREALEEVRSQADPLAAVADIMDAASRGIRASVERLDTLLGDTGATMDAAGAEETVRQIQRMQFLYKLRSEAEGLEADLEDES